VKLKIWEKENPHRFMPLYLKELSAEEYQRFKEDVCKEFEETYDDRVAKVPSVRKEIKMRFDKSSFPSYEAVSQGLYSLNMLPLINRLNLTEELKMADGTSPKVVQRHWGTLSCPMEDSPIEYNERQAPVSIKVAANFASVGIHEHYVCPDPEEDDEDGDCEAKRGKGASRVGGDGKGEDELELLPGVKLKDVWHDPNQGVGGRRAGSSLDNPVKSNVHQSPFQTMFENPGKIVFDPEFLARNP
jgi:hypothetical protein